VRNRTVAQFGGGAGAPAAANYALCFLAGAIWYLQFLFYGMGRTTMGRYDFTSWSIFMACIIIFSNLWGVLFGEWAGTGRKTKVWLVMGLVVLALSAVLTSYGDYLQSHGS
jgi:L-rhamnose-H+ transport protein